MSKNIAAILVGGALMSTFSFNVQAFPLSSTPAHVVGTDITPVAGLCGIGRHRGPYGGCIPNGVVVVPAPYAPPVVVAPVACPYGYHFAYGRCYPGY